MWLKKLKRKMNAQVKKTKTKKNKTCRDFFFARYKFKVIYELAIERALKKVAKNYVRKKILEYYKSMK